MKQQLGSSPWGCLVPTGADGARRSHHRGILPHHVPVCWLLLAVGCDLRGGPDCNSYVDSPCGLGFLRAW